MPAGASKDISRSESYTGSNYDIEGWNLRVGVFNGANVTIKNIKYWQGGGGNYAMVDGSSKLNVTGMSGNNWQHPISYYVAAPKGVTFTCALANNANNTIDTAFNYYLTGEGSVSYQAITKKSTHTIKAADVQLSAASDWKGLRNKPLITWTSTANATFAAAASIKIMSSDGQLQTTQTIDSISDSPTLSASDEAGSCQLVKKSTGIYLYYVDYLPAQDFAYDCYGTIASGVFTGGSPSGWITSFDDSFDTSGPFLFGPTTTSMTFSPMVQADHRPYKTLASRDKYTILLYADVEEAAAGSVLLSYGDMNNNKMHALLKTSDGKVKLSCCLGASTEAGSGITTETANYKGYHLYAITFDSTTGQKLYVDGVLVGENASATTAPYSSGGLQIGSGFGKNPSGYVSADGMAVYGVYGYDDVLSAGDIAALASIYPAKTSYTFGSEYSFNDGKRSDGSLMEVHYHDCDATAGNGRFGASNGKIVIPEGNTITAKCYRFLNRDQTGDSVENIVNGTVIIAADSNGAQVQSSGVGVLFGHWKGTGVYTINSTGLIDCQNAYFMTCYTAGNQTITINGGTVKTKGFSCYKRDGGTTKLVLGGNGLIEVSECLTVANVNYASADFTQEYGYGTIKFTGSGKTITAPQAATFTDSENGTTIDVNGNNVTFSGALSGSGKVIFTDTAGTGSVTLSGAVSANVVVPADMTVNVASGGKLTGNISGAGKIVFAAPPASGESNFPSGTTGWTGTVEFDTFSAAAEKLDKYGNANSKIVLNGISSGYLIWNHTRVEAEIELRGDFNITDMSPNVQYTFDKICGSGNISVSPGGSGDQLGKFEISELVNYRGRITNNMPTTHITITTLDLPDGTMVVADQCILPFGEGVGEIDVSNVKVGGETATFTWEKRSDGIYVRSDYMEGTANMDGTTAVIVNTSQAVTIPAEATALRIYPTAAGDVVFTLSAAQDAATQTGDFTVSVKSKIEATGAEVDVSAYFTATGYDSSTHTYSYGLIASSVRPVVSDSVVVGGAATAPMSVSGGGSPTFAFATKPGLWYAVATSTDADTFVVDKDSIVQAGVGETAKTVSALGPSTTSVMYYKVAVGASKAELTPATP